MVRRGIAIAVALLMVVSMGAFMTAAASPRVKAEALTYDVIKRDTTTRGARDGGTKVFLQVHGNVGVASNGVGIYLKNDTQPVYIDMSRADIPLGAEVKEAYLYWGGNMGDGPIDCKIPDHADELMLLGEKVKGAYIGYEHMDTGNNRRAFRANVTGIVQGSLDSESGYNHNYKVQFVPGGGWISWGSPNGQHRACFGASLVVVFVHQSITAADVCIADGANIMDQPDQDDGLPDDGNSAHITPYSVSGLSTRTKYPSALKGIIGSYGEADDLVPYKFTAFGASGDTVVYNEADVLYNEDGGDWDDHTYDLTRDDIPYGIRTPGDTNAYVIDMYNADSLNKPWAPGQTARNAGGYSDLYVDWFWFAARIDFALTKTAKLVVDQNGDGLVNPGDTIEYTLKYRNKGSSPATDVVLTDDFDEDLVQSVTDISGGGSHQGEGTIVWNIGRLDTNSETFTQTYRATLRGQAAFPATGPANVVNTATLLDRATGYLNTARNTEAVTRLVGLAAKVPGSNTWYLAEGSTGSDYRGGFETWVLLQNAGTNEAHANLTYMTPQGEVAGPPVTLKPSTRTTINVADTVKDNWSVSTKVTSDQPIIAERAMYWDTNGGAYRESATDSIGVTNSSKNWFLAEGSTGKDDKGQFETWILLQNPGTQPAQAKITYMTPTGEKAGPEPTLEPGTRETFNVAANVPDNWSVSTKVTSDQPIIAERAQYWHSAVGVYRQAAHDSIGVADSAQTWFLAEGSTGKDDKGQFETWILLANPGTEPAKAKITYMTPTSEKAGPEPTLEPGTRETFNVAANVPDNWSVSTKVTSDQPIIAERAQYWSSASGIFRLAAHDSIGIDP